MAVKRLLFLPFVLAISVTIAAQQSSTLFLMHSLPESNLVNPAIQIPCRIYIGMPLLNSVHLNYSNTAFSYNNIIHPAGNGVNVDLNYLSSFSRSIQLMAIESDINLLSFGYKYQAYYFTFNVTERFSGMFTGNTDLGKLIANGNSAYIGTNLDLSGFRFNLNWYREWALGVSKVVNSNLTIGGRAKLLFGKANIRTTESTLGIATGNIPYPVTINSSFVLNSAGPLSFPVGANGNISGAPVFSTNSIVGTLLNRQNIGAALDFGVIYKLSDVITLSGSLLDIGFIRWSSTVKNYAEQGNPTFNGITVGRNNTSIVDTITNSFSFKVTNNAYYAATQPKMYLGGTYEFYPNINAGLVSRTELFPGYFHQSFTASTNATFKNYLQGSLSWSYLNGSFANIGAGIGMRTPTWGCYVVSDNFYGMLYWKSSRTENIRFGFYAMFGCSNKKSKKIPAAVGCSNLRNEESSENRFKAWIKKMKKKKKQ